MIVVTRGGNWAAVAETTEKVESPVFVFHCIFSREAAERLFALGHKSQQHKTPDAIMGVVIETGLRALENSSIKDCRDFINQ